jgi:hypothetical protein
MPEDLFVDVRYQGLELGRRLRIEEFGAATAYLHHPAPMPVGAKLLIEADESLEVSVQVTRVNEQVAGSERPAGMFVEPHGLSGKAEDWWAARVAGSSTDAPEVDGGTTQPMEAVPVHQEAEPEQAAVVEAAPEAPKDEAKPEAKPAKAKKKRSRRKKSK